jgi:hypothetical protein
LNRDRRGEDQVIFRVGGNSFNPSCDYGESGFCLHEPNVIGALSASQALGEVGLFQGPSDFRDYWRGDHQLKRAAGPESK